MPDTDRLLEAVDIPGITRTSARMRSGPGGVGTTTRSLTQAIELDDWRATVNGTHTDINPPKSSGRLNGRELARFDAKHESSPSGCEMWTAYINPQGYGVFKVRGRAFMAHRVAYEHHRELIPAHMVIDHLCRHRACVNPDHLEVVTPLENWQRGLAPSAINVRRQRCARGHDLCPDNRGYRTCLTCAVRRGPCPICGVTLIIRNRARHIREIHRKEKTE